MQLTAILASMRIPLAILLLYLSAEAQTIVTVAGAPLGDGGPAAAGTIYKLRGIALDSAGNVYAADSDNHRVRKIGVDGRITTVAGTGWVGFSGDNGPATVARLNSPAGVAVDAAGNLYIADSRNHRVRKVAPDGAITTVAGTGSAGFSGDGGPAIAAQLNSPQSLAVDGAGNVFIQDSANRRIRRIAASDGSIATVAGTGLTTFNGDGGPATAANLAICQFGCGGTGVAVDGAGNLYIGDDGNRRVRKVDTSTGNISTVAGTGSSGFSGDGGPATLARVGSILGLALDTAGNLYIADAWNGRIRRVTAADGNINTIAGIGGVGYSGDGGPATAARFWNPAGVAVDASGNVWIQDSQYSRLRRITAADGIINLVAGNGFGYAGDGGPAAAALLYQPITVAAAGDDVYIGDAKNAVIRRIDPSGAISTIAGTYGVTGNSGDGEPATAATLGSPSGIVRDAEGNVYFSDASQHVVRMIAPDGTISTVVGTGIAGFSGDSGPALAAQINNPSSLALDGSGSLYIGDFGNRRVRKVTGGTISTVAGRGSGSELGDGGPATDATLDPTGVAVDATGNLYIADYMAYRVRRVDTDGNINTYAGNGTSGYLGDGGPALAASIRADSVAVDSAGQLYIADTRNRVVRVVDTEGIINTVAGNGTEAFSGEGGPATEAQLKGALSISLGPPCNLFIADNYYTVRAVKAAGCLGAVNVTTNLPTSTFTIAGPAVYPGSGTSWSRANAPEGVYTATFGAVAGYVTPSPRTLTLSAGASISFSGTYAQSIGTVRVAANLAGATFSITGPSEYTGSGASWSQTGAPAGTYTVTYGAIQGYITPPPETKTLEAGGEVVFDAVYSRDVPGVPAPPSVILVLAGCAGLGLRRLTQIVRSRSRLG